MRKLFWMLAALATVGGLVFQQRELRAARLRGDMYRDIAARLDKRVVELTEGATDHA